MNESYEHKLEQLYLGLRELKKLIVLKETEFPIKRIEQFVLCNELLEQILQEYYWQHYSGQEVPQEGQASTVLSELASSKKMPQEHAIDLLEQFTIASFLATPSWLASQPQELPFLQECIEKIPHYHDSIVVFLKLLESL